MKEIVREGIIYQLLAVGLTFFLRPDSSFLASLPAILIITNCIAWSTRFIFAYASRRHGFMRWRGVLRIAFGIPALAAGCLVGLLVASLILRHIFGLNLYTGALFLSIYKISLLVALVATVLILAYYTVRERLESEALEQERLKGLRARAELSALQSKLNPHFLFNTLNTMVHLVHTEPDKVEEMILGLSEIYRKVLGLPAEERIPLAEEFDLARRYLEIEKVRLGERLRYAIDLPRPLEGKPVSPLLVQPLVENAVVHGLSPKPGGGRLRLSASESAGRVRIVVEDDGVGFAESPSPAAGGAGGFGLVSVRERMRILYGDGGAMTIASPAAGGTRITLELPLAD